jgi:hypothetical protein
MRPAFDSTLICYGYNFPPKYLGEPAGAVAR